MSSPSESGFDSGAMIPDTTGTLPGDVVTLDPGSIDYHYADLDTDWFPR
ncbi:hypothetical protein [Cryptosporangium phraense]|nr:hypothetical protein [Cryptosporangium phraense]